MVRVWGEWRMVRVWGEWRMVRVWGQWEDGEGVGSVRGW